jgi:N-acetylmuramoyl-L-alanine amidase
VKKAVCAFLIFLLLASGMPAAPSAAARPTYVRLGQWARANVFTLQWLERDKTLQLTGYGARLVFNVDPHSDTRKAEINGVQVWLAYPIVSQNGSVLISQVDLSETIGPTLAPPANPRGIRVQKICIDAGHGGTDPGYQVGGNDEKKYTFLLAQEVRTQLKAAGFDVVLSRTTDFKVPLDERTAIARRAGADVFVSLHFNAFPQDTQIHGTEVYCCTPPGAYSFNSRGEGDTRWFPGNRNDEKNMLLAYQVMKSYEKNLGIEDRGVKRGRLQVLREATMPAILIEGGFMSNPAEGKKIYDPMYRKQMARALVEGILAYKKAVKG